MNRAKLMMIMVIGLAESCKTDPTDCNSNDDLRSRAEGAQQSERQPERQRQR